MAEVDVSVSSTMEPDQAWKLASDLSRFGEWMTIFGGWKSEVPAVIDKGVTVSSLIKVKGFRNVIHWEVTEYDYLNKIALAGTGRGGVRIGLTMSIRHDNPGSTFHLVARLSGSLLNGKIGDFVAKLMENDVRRSVENLAELG
ncbi:MAG: SRPBCC family protein [Mycobacterium sp.]|nr:SRPBCC family protein [Mycobacterium sp.]